MKKPVPVLITCDIDPTPEATIKDKRTALRQCGDMFNDLGISATFYTVANVAADYESLLRDLIAEGHEIGCHGLTHADDEEFSTMPLGRLRPLLNEATELLQKATETSIRSFRGPRVKTSEKTHQVLEELGYHSDSSVCSQRLDFVSSNLINPHWLFAPRRSYHPSEKSAFRRGSRQIWELPVSALMLPFISGMLYIFGLGAMKLFFNLLYIESRLTGKPVVYLLHPAEYSPMTIKVKHPTGLKAILARGFYFRSRLKLSKTPEIRLQITRQLLEFMTSKRNVKFMTSNQYVEFLNHAE